MSPPQVLVVGSGPSGLVLALVLLQNGISVRVVEKNTEHHNSERGSGVMPRTLEIEHFLGVGEEVKRTGLGTPVMNIFDPHDPHRIIKSFLMVEKVEPSPAFPMTEGTMIGQWLHQQILRKHLEALGCHVELGCALEGIKQEDDCVVARLAKTENGKQVEETVKFAYVVGADGARSAVRKLLGIDFVGESRDMSVYLVDARIEGMPADGNGFWRWGDGVKRTANLRYTTRPGVFQMLIAGENVDIEALKTGSVEVIQSTFNSLSGRTDLKVTEILTHSEWRPSMRIAGRFRVGRAFIVGDAAHVHPPSGGQGLNSSIQDSFNLAWKLALSLKSHASATLLNSYESERLPVIAEMLKITTTLFNKMAARAETKRTLEAAKSQAAEAESLGDKDKEAFSRERKLLQLDLNYRWSDAVFDERFVKDETGAKRDAYGVVGHDVRAGDRAPDAPGLSRVDNNTEGENAITRLFDIFNTSSHTALVFSSDPSDSSMRALLDPLANLATGLVRTVLILPTGASDVNTSSLNVDSVFRDTEGHAFSGYGLHVDSGKPTVVIVRPDAMIGAVVQSASGVEKYISMVFA